MLSFSQAFIRLGLENETFYQSWVQHSMRTSFCLDLRDLLREPEWGVVQGLAKHFVLLCIGYYLNLQMCISLKSFHFPCKKEEVTITLALIGS